MAHEPNADEHFDQLRRLVARDPKQARLEFALHMERGGIILQELLERASQPGEGRVRQMVATYVRLSSSAEGIEDWLRRWLEAEGDEFTRRAIETAIGSGPKTTTKTTAQPKPRNSQTLDTYRYVADRLCHRVRNALTRPGAQFLRLEHCVKRIDDPAIKAELLEAIGVLQTGFQRVARVVEFDVGDDYMLWQDISLAAWLERAAVDYAARFGPARLTITGSVDDRRRLVRATRFHLETLFGNLWANAVQAVETAGGCEIVAAFSLAADGRMLQILITDNGPGFNEKHLETAFQQTFSTKSRSRGRGLLEIADAILHLQGEVRLLELGRGEYRIQILMPVKSA